MPTPSDSRRDAPRATGSTPWMSRIAPAGTWRRPFLALLALVGAAPSLVWAFGSPGFMHDDWGLADTFTRGDLGQRWSALWVSATHQPGRPGAAIYYAVTYGLFGTHVVLHALLLALICGVLAVLVFLVAERLWRTDVALWIAAVYAVLPNRGSTRLWFAVATYPLALVLLLVGALLLLRGRPVLAAVLLAAAVLTYEGVFGLAILAVAMWTIADLSRRWRTGLAAAAAVVASGALVFAMSPKRDGGRHMGGLDRMISSQFGVGIFEWTAVARLAPVALALGLTLMVVIRHRQRDRYRGVLAVGGVVLLAGWVPFFLTDWPIATDGFFDRANGVVGLGTAVVLGVLLAWLVDVAPGRAGLVLALTGLLLLLGLNAPDVQAFRQATHRGQTLLDQVGVAVPPGSGPLKIVPPPTADRGVSQFPAGSNLSAALRFRRGDWVVFWIEPSVEEQPLPADASCFVVATSTITSCDAVP